MRPLTSGTLQRGPEEDCFGRMRKGNKVGASPVGETGTTIASGLSLGQGLGCPDRDRRCLCSGQLPDTQVPGYRWQGCDQAGSWVASLLPFMRPVPGWVLGIPGSEAQLQARRSEDNFPPLLRPSGEVKSAFPRARTSWFRNLLETPLQASWLLAVCTSVRQIQ